MKLHIRNIHGKKSKATKRSSILTPLPNPSKRVKPSAFALLNSEVAFDESLLSMSWTGDDKVNLVELPSVFTCDSCQFASESKEELEKHVNLAHTISRQDSFSCEICNLEFPSISIFDDHIANEHKSQSVKDPHSSPIKMVLLPCESCDFHATSEAVLKDHLS